MKDLDKSVAIAELSKFLILNEIHVEEFTDFGNLEGIINNSDKPYLTPVLSDKGNDFYTSNAMWLVGKKSGKVVMVGGARLEDIGDEPVSSYWPRLFKRHYQGEAITDVNPALDALFKGRLVYFGDLYVEKGAGGSKRLNTRAFIMIAHLLASLKWSPDLTYSFIQRRAVTVGSASVHGFNETFPRPFRWLLQDGVRSDMEQCCYTRRAFLEANTLDLLDDIRHQNKGTA